MPTIRRFLCNFTGSFLEKWPRVPPFWKKNRHTLTTALWDWCLNCQNCRQIWPFFPLFICNRWCWFDIRYFNICFRRWSLPTTSSISSFTPIRYMVSIYTKEAKGEKKRQNFVIFFSPLASLEDDLYQQQVALSLQLDIWWAFTLKRLDGRRNDKILIYKLNYFLCA